MNLKLEKLTFKKSRFFSFIPFGIFIIVTIGLSFCGITDINMMTGTAVLALLLGMFFCTNIDIYWEVIIKGFGSKIGMTAVLLWLIVGIYCNILKNGNIVGGLVWLGLHTHLNSSAFVVLTFFFSAIFSIATGSGFGTISTMGFILFPTGILMGAKPEFLAGAILSGTAFGGCIAPIFDTTIIASTTQEDFDTNRTTDIGTALKARLPLVIIAGVISAVLFYLFGGTKTANINQNYELLQKFQEPKGLLLLISTFLVIIMAIKGINLFVSLSVGIVSAIVIGCIAKLFDLSSLCTIKDGQVSGAIPDGIAGMTAVSILLIVVVSMGELLIESGCLNDILNWLNEKVIKTPKGAEKVMYVLITIFSILIAAINSLACICVAPFVNAIGKKNHIDPIRRTNLLIAGVNTFPFFIPYGGCVLVLLGSISTISKSYSFIPEISQNSMIGTTFFPWILWILFFMSCFNKKSN